MHITLWILQGLLASVFTVGGILILFQSREKAAGAFPWIHDLSPSMVRINGLAKVGAGMGLVVPMLTGVAPVLTPVAALGLCVLMVLATAYNLRKDKKSVPVTLFFLTLAAFVAWFRF